MGSVDVAFATDLRGLAGLRRAVETGTFRGLTARGLAGVFDEVVTIELSAELHRSASARLADVANVRLVQGHSAVRLRELADATAPTLYFLDGHWSGGDTSGVEDECPVLEELDAVGSGHPDDCFIIDDARLFTSSPPPPHHPERWPSLLQVIDAIRARYPEHLVTVLDDQILAAPPKARPAIDRHGQRVQHVSPVLAGARAAVGMVRSRLGR